MEIKDLTPDERAALITGCFFKLGQWLGQSELTLPDILIELEVRTLRILKIVNEVKNVSS